MMMILGLNKTIGWRKENHQKKRNLSELIVGTTRIWMERETIPNNQVGIVLFGIVFAFLLFLFYLCNLPYIFYLCDSLYWFWQRFGLTCGIVQRSDGLWNTGSALVSRMISLKDTQFLTTDHYQLCRTHHRILSRFLHPEAQIAPIEKREPIKSNGKSSRYLFEYELCMLWVFLARVGQKNTNVHGSTKDNILDFPNKLRVSS